MTLFVVENGLGAFDTIEEANLFIDKANVLLGYPDNTGTLTYSVPEIVEEKENEVVIKTTYEVTVTEELNELLNKEINNNK